MVRQEEQTQLVIWIEMDKKGLLKAMTSVLKTTMTEVIRHRIDTWMQENKDESAEVVTVLGQ